MIPTSSSRLDLTSPLRFEPAADHLRLGPQQTYLGRRVLRPQLAPGRR